MVNARDDRAKRNIATALCNQLITTACGIVTLRVLLASLGVRHMCVHYTVSFLHHAA